MAQSAHKVFTALFCAVGKTHHLKPCQEADRLTTTRWEDHNTLQECSHHRLPLYILCLARYNWKLCLSSSLSSSHPTTIFFHPFFYFNMVFAEGRSQAGTSKDTELNSTSGSATEIRRWGRYHKWHLCVHSRSEKGVLFCCSFWPTTWSPLLAVHLFPSDPGCFVQPSPASLHFSFSVIPWIPLSSFLAFAVQPLLFYLTSQPSAQHKLTLTPLQPILLYTIPLLCSNLYFIPKHLNADRQTDQSQQCSLAVVEKCETGQPIQRMG